MKYLNSNFTVYSKLQQRNWCKDCAYEKSKEKCKTCETTYGKGKNYQKKKEKVF